MSIGKLRTRSSIIKLSLIKLVMDNLTVRAVNLFADVAYQYHYRDHLGCIIDEDSNRSSSDHFLDIISDGVLNWNMEWWTARVNPSSDCSSWAGWGTRVFPTSSVSSTGKRVRTVLVANRYWTTEK